MTVPTVRVANPKTSTGYMLINASDYREMVHGPLWHEQEPGFDGRLPPPSPVQPLSDEEHRKAASLMFELIEAEREERGLPRYASLTAMARLQWLDKKREEFLEVRSRYATRMDAPEVVVPDGVVPGETPGWPIDAISGKPLWMPDEARQRIAEQARMDAAAQDAEWQRLAREQAPPGGEGGQTATSQPTPPPSQEPPSPAAQQPATGGEQPAWLRPPQAAAQDAPPPPPPPPPVAEKLVEKGPGGKWYVMQDGKPVSDGLKTKAEAEAQMTAAPKE